MARCMPFATACGQTATCWSWAFATTMMWSAVGGGNWLGWEDEKWRNGCLNKIMGNH